MEGYVYAWSSEGGLKGWRVQRSKPTLAHALGKVRLRHQSMILPSWPQSYKVGDSRLL